MVMHNCFKTNFFSAMSTCEGNSLESIFHVDIFKNGLTSFSWGKLVTLLGCRLVLNSIDPFYYDILLLCLSCALDGHLHIGKSNLPGRDNIGFAMVH